MSDPPVVASAGASALRDETERFVADVGARVRAARRQAGIPRRVLSERSGVSQRYLAQLESGAGNISIGRLYELARALGRSVESLVSDVAPAHGHKGRRIALIGLRGAGKSTLGERLAGALDLPFVELAREVEGNAGVAAGEVMALYGNEGFRRLEREALQRVVASTDAVVLAVAGGIVESAVTYELLLERFHTVWLRAAPDEHMARVRAQGDERPMAGDPQALATLESILRAREPAYARADRTLDTAGRAVEHSAAELIETASALLSASDG